MGAQNTPTELWVSKWRRFSVLPAEPRSVSTSTSSHQLGSLLWWFCAPYTPNITDTWEYVVVYMLTLLPLPNFSSRQYSYPGPRNLAPILIPKTHFECFWFTLFLYVYRIHIFICSTYPRSSGHNFERFFFSIWYKHSFIGYNHFDMFFGRNNPITLIPTFEGVFSQHPCSLFKLW